MISPLVRLAAVGLLAGYALGTTATSARAEPVAAILASDDDVRKTILIGPSGQFWEPDGSGTWIRRSPGGVAADVAGVTRAEDLLIVTGKATPAYRRIDDEWRALRLGERGRTLSDSGPRGAIAIGKHVFVYSGSAWKRVATSERPFTAIWAASDTSIFLGGKQGVTRLVGRGFRVHAPTPIAAFGGGPTPWAVTADAALLEVIPKRVHRPMVSGSPLAVERVVVAPDRSVWALGRTGSGPALVHRTTGEWNVAPAPALGPDDAVVGLAVDRQGLRLIATQTGTLHLGQLDGTWSLGTLTDALPTPRSGPGPARTQ